MKTQASPDLCFDVATVISGSSVQVMCIVKEQHHFFMSGHCDIQQQRNILAWIFQ
jgi:hypothetical protein